MKRSKAFTLIELLIAIALASAVTVTLFYFAFSSTRSISCVIDASKSDQSARLVAGRISSDIIGSGGAIAGSGRSKLDLGGLSYEFRDGKVRREEGSDAYYLTVEGEIRGLKFSYPSSKLVRIEVTPKHGGSYNIDVYARN